MTENEIVDAEELVYVGKGVVHLVRFEYGDLVSLYCGPGIPRGDAHLDERAAWAHMPVCQVCLRGRAAHRRHVEEQAQRARAEAAVPEWL